jgi:H+-transporting ATPase
MSGVDILCADKTGTITKNQLTVAEVKPSNGFKDTDVLLFGSLASREEDKDPIDTAIITKAKADSSVASVLNGFKEMEFKPFDPVIKRTEVSVEDSKGTGFKVSKGAPQVILKLVSATKDLEDKVDQDINQFALKGHRALGVAKTDNNGKWLYVGLVALYDPPREDSAETIETAQSMGVQV